LIIIVAIAQQNYSGKAAEEHRGLNLIILSENQIQSSYAARNKGIKSARYPFLASTDADCRPAPQWLTEFNPTL
jgi:glycosyltransferase involved in cell wall biosynthesis